jgi:hypothetical protein
MQKKTKTNRNRTAPIEEAQTKKTRTPSKRRAARSTQKVTEQTTGCSWLKSNTSRPKTLVVQMQRTAAGYTIKEATVLSPVNQHASRQIPVNVRAVTEDINRRGIII